MALASGSKLGHCEILAPLGAGRRGELYRARDTRLEHEATEEVAMLASMERLLTQYESGRMNRRDLLGALAMLAAPPS